MNLLRGECGAQSWKNHEDLLLFPSLVLTVKEKPGFIKAMWCEDQACEDKIKEETSATSRCMPFEQEAIAETCVCCGKKASKLVYWAKAY